MYNSGYIGGLQKIKNPKTQQKGTPPPPKKKQDWDKTLKHVIDHSSCIINWYNKSGYSYK